MEVQDLLLATTPVPAGVKVQYRIERFSRSRHAHLVGVHDRFLRAFAPLRFIFLKFFNPADGGAEYKAFVSRWFGSGASKETPEQW